MSESVHPLREALTGIRPDDVSAAIGRLADRGMIRDFEVRRESLVHELSDHSIGPIGQLLSYVVADNYWELCEALGSRERTEDMLLGIDFAVVIIGEILRPDRDPY